MKKKKSFIKDILFSIALVMIFSVLISISSGIEPQVDYQNISTSQNISLHEAAKKYENFAKDLQYNISNKGKNITFEQFKTEGGVCQHFAELYANLARADGFHAKSPIILMNETTSHQVTIISNSEGYCLLEIHSYACTKRG